MVIKADELTKDLGILGEVVIGYARLGMGSGSGIIIADLAYRKIYYYDQDNSQVPAIAPVVESINILTLNNSQLAGTRIRLGYPNYDHKRLYMLGFDTGEGLQSVGNLLPQEQLTSASLYPSVGNIVNFRIMPQDTPDTTVFVNPSPYYDNLGVFNIWGGSDTENLITDAIAALTSGQHQMVVICLDISTGDLEIVTNTASAGGVNDKGLFDWTTIATDMTFSDTDLLVGAVHIYEGQTEITEDDIYRSADPRVGFSKPVGGGGTVTDVTATSPLSSSGGATPDISLDDTAVTPGSYTNTNLTVDSQGRITAASNGSAGAAGNYILIQDRKTSGTNGGTFTSGSWQTRDLNTIVDDAGTIASVSSNQFTLPAGTYRIRAKCPAQYVYQHQGRLYNITDTAVQQSTGGFDILGTSEYTAALAATSYVTSTVIEGRFTIAGTKTFEIQHQCGTTKTGDGFGVAGSLGAEVYTTVELIKE